MTLGLAVGEEDAIYLAIESEGLPTSCRGPGSLPGSRRLLLESKIIDLQFDPSFSVLCAGGLDHWCHVAANYLRRQTLLEAAEEIRELLDCCMTPNNRAFGVVCGFVKGVATCYRIDRDQAAHATISDNAIALDHVEPIGLYDQQATSLAKQLIASGTDKLHAIVAGIDSQIGQRLVRRPIHVRIMQRNT
jgi:hypothetical protein